MKDSDARRDFRLQGAGRDPHVVLGLQVQPEAGLHTEEEAKAQCRIGRNRAVAVDQFTDAARRDVDVGGKLARGDAVRFQEVFQQNFARVDFVK